MQPISRRKMLQYGTAAALGPALPFAMPSRAEAAWVAIALAAAAFVAGRIASHNQRNAQAYMLISIREELRVATLQLASLQAAVSVVLDDLSKLPDKIEELLRRQSVLDIHLKIKANIGLYIEEIEIRPQYNNDKEWFGASRRQERLNSILDDLRRTRQLLLNSSTPVDPSAAIVMSSAALVEISLMNVGNTKSKVYDQKSVLQTISSYESYFNLVKKDALAGSAAWYRNQHEARKQKLVKEFAPNPLLTKLTSTPSMMNCAQIQSYQVSCPVPEAVYRASCAQRPAGVSLTEWRRRPNRCCFCQGPNTDVYRLYQELRFDNILAQDHPEVKAQLTKLQIVPTAEEKPLTLTQFTIGEPNFQSRQATENWNAGPSENCGCEIRDFNELQLNKSNTSRIIDVIKGSEEWKRSAQHYKVVSDYVDLVNLESAKIAYATQALSAVDESLKSLAAVKRSFQK